MAHDATDSSFESDVLERSRSVLVLVDFWAEWCGPCTMLTPILEEVVAEFDGSVELVKVNTDENRELASQYHIRGIPAVKAFRDGEIVSEFQGALPKHQVEQFIRKCLPSEADEWVAQARAAQEEGKTEPALEYVIRALAADSRHPEALFLKGEMDFDAGRWEEAEVGLKRVGIGGVMGKRASGLLSRIALSRFRAADAESPAPVEGSPEACLREGTIEVCEENFERGFKLLIQAVQDPACREAAKERMVLGFAIQGVDHPVTRNYRNQLAMWLY